MPPTNRPHLRVVGETSAGSGHDGPGDSEPVVVIDCEVCVRQASDECDDCIVSYLVDHDPDKPVVFGPDEQQAVELLADAGLVPRSRFQARPGVA